MCYFCSTGAQSFTRAGIHGLRRVTCCVFVSSIRQYRPFGVVPSNWTQADDHERGFDKTGKWGPKKEDWVGFLSLNGERRMRTQRYTTTWHESTLRSKRPFAMLSSLPRTTLTDSSGSLARSWFTRTDSSLVSASCKSRIPLRSSCSHSQKVSRWRRGHKPQSTPKATQTRQQACRQYMARIEETAT